MSWKQGEQAGGFLRPQEGSRDPGMLWEQGEQGWGFLRPQGCSARKGSKGSKLGARGVSWGLPEAPGRFQRPRDGLGASWEQAGGFLRPQEGTRDPGMLWEQGE